MYVRAVRGATTVENNTSEEIINETINLLNTIIEKNQINKDYIISAIFSLTNDLNAAFPAAAARKIGWTDIALMCTNEVDVPGSLKKCIRVMVHFNTEKSNSELRHVYIKGAKALRPDLAE
jgi:chorismate mutase